MPKKTFLKLTAVSLLFLTASSHAGGFAWPPASKMDFSKAERDAAATDPGFYTLNPGSVKMVPDSCALEKDLEYPDPSKTGLAEGLVLIDRIINIASKVWDIIQQNAPVVSIDTKYASAVPQGIEAWNQLSGWSKPHSCAYSFNATNLFGVRTVDVTYKVIYTSGGNYQGKGRYLTGVTVVPTNVNVKWGYRFSFAAQVPDSTIVNAGSAEDPVAALQLKLGWKISTAFQSTEGVSVYYIRGDGSSEEIASPFPTTKMIVDADSAEPLLTDQTVIFR
jgi:hypothetical protein